VNRRDPLLPRPVLVFLAVVVALGWLATVASAVRDPSNSGPLLMVTGLLATVIGASFGIQVKRSRNDDDRNSGDGSS
jgi:nitrate/nitrite transporter NarK